MSDEAATRPPHLNELYLQGDDDRQAHVGCPVGLGGTPDGDWFEPVNTLGEAIDAGRRHLGLHHSTAGEPMQAAVQAVSDFLNQCAEHPGGAIGSQRSVIDGLKQMSGVGRLDLAVRVAEVALAAAMPLLRNEGHRGTPEGEGV